MMAGNPSWWGMFPPSLLPTQFSLSSSLNSFADSQLLIGDEDRLMNQSEGQYQPKKVENWEEQLMNPSPATDIVKHEEVSGESNSFYGQTKSEELLMIQAGGRRNWSQIVSPAASSCVSTLTTQNNKLLNFSFSFNNNNADQRHNHAPPENSSECNSSAAGGACKKTRFHPSSSHPPLKVRKEKLVDRITALHQIVSPFGKTDTASVLSEAIGYIRFLQGQIQALSSPYLSNPPKHIRNPQSALLNDSCLKRKATLNQEEREEENAWKDLRSRGLCLVPVSCTQLVGGDSNNIINGADYWAPAANYNATAGF